MHNFKVEDSLKKDIKKLLKKDKITYGALMNKIKELIECQDIAHYKNLRSPLQDFKRVHINGPFVLIFKYNQLEDEILFFKLEHHDKVYKVTV